MNKKQILELLEQVKDPELPSINVVELGVVRDVLLEGQRVVVVITPTYSGCPALDVMKNDITNVLAENGIQSVQLKVTLSPCWTTDWISDKTKEKLRKIGIAAPSDRQLVQLPSTIVCPRCKSIDTECRSEFGSTACKALWFCNSCLEPFDYFKKH